MICLHKPFGNQELLQIVKMTLTTNDKSKIECSNKRDRVKLPAMFLEEGTMKDTFLQTFCRCRNYICWNSLSIICSICIL